VNSFRIALANLRFPATPEESIALAEQAIAQAAIERAGLICFPECFIPGYRGIGKRIPPPDSAFLERAWSAVASAAAKANHAVILGTERILDGALLATALVVNRDGTIAGFQDKVQLDPSEESIYSPGSGRRIFQTGLVTFGVAICHEGWRYPETVRWAARHGAHIVFHPHFHEAEPGSYRPSTFADPANSFHEKAALCRAAENICYFATVNFAGEGSPTTSAVVRPDGTLLCYQPYGKHGLLIADIDITRATGLLAARSKSIEISAIGHVRSILKDRSAAPRQGSEGAPNATLEILPSFIEALDGIQAGQDIWIFTWLHESRRSVLKVHPRGDARNPLSGVFATRSPDRPNPIGLHRAKVLSVTRERWLEVEGLEAIDGTPIVDLKPVIEGAAEVYQGV
jgi:tRNA-Thr(GGU) m(6)t(6)A37 methyltransferase TsaA